MRSALSFLSSGAAVLALAGVALADQPSQWDFNNRADPLAASFGPGVMTFWDSENGGIPGGTQSITEFGTTAFFGINPIGGVVADVMRVPPYLGVEGLLVDHRTPSNGGGVYVNQYTLVFDVYVTQDAITFGSGWFPFHNTNCCNTNDADAYIQFGVGIGINGDYTGTFNADTWHRVAFVYDLAQTDPQHWKYIDGVLVGTQVFDGLDGRFALYTPSDPDPYDSFFLFTEPEGLYTNEAYINSVYYADRALSGTEIAALGVADADGIGGPPAACPGDLDGDNDVDISDLSVLLSQFGSTGGGLSGDLDDDGDVDISDLATLLSVFGTTC